MGNGNYKDNASIKEKFVPVDTKNDTKKIYIKKDLKKKYLVINYKNNSVFGPAILNCELVKYRYLILILPSYILCKLCKLEAELILVMNLKVL